MFNILLKTFLTFSIKNIIKPNKNKIYCFLELPLKKPFLSKFSLKF